MLANVPIVRGFEVLRFVHDPFHDTRLLMGQFFDKVEPFLAIGIPLEVNAGSG